MTLLLIRFSWCENGNRAPQRSGEGLYIECRGWHDWPLGPWGRYLSLRSVQHQIIEFAEDALLQLVPGDTSVLMHEKWRAKPEEDEEKEKKEEHQGRRGWLRLSGWFTFFFFFFYMKHTCCDQEALLISWWHLARLFSRIWKKKKRFPLGRWYLVRLTQEQGCVACYSWYTHNKHTRLYGNKVSGLLRRENSSRSLKVFPLRPSVNHHVNFWLRLLSCIGL